MATQQERRSSGLMSGQILFRTMWISTSLSVVLLCLQVDMSFSAEKFRKLNRSEIGARIIGKSITDEAHWVQHYQKDGKLISFDMGKRSEGRWEIQKDQLCVWARFADGACYEVWVAGDEVELRLEGIEPHGTAYIRDSHLQ